MAAVGRMVVGAAAVEYLVVVLVAVTEGNRDGPPWGPAPTPPGVL